MKKVFSGILLLLLWTAVMLQLFLMLQNRVFPIGETLIRFFSYFTILTNTLCAVYFTAAFFERSWTRQPGWLTALTLYIFVVGLVYQLVLRKLWEPTGLQQWVDELLHSVNPLLVFFYWIAYERKHELKYSMVPGWLIYPLVYLLYILIRGNISGFYPYPFLQVPQIGLRQVLMNSGLLLAGFILLSTILIYAGSRKTGSKTVIKNSLEE